MNEAQTRQPDRDTLDLAYQAWRNQELTLFEVKRIFGVDIEDLYGHYKKLHPYRAAWEGWKVHLALGFAFTIIKIRWWFRDNLRWGG